MSQDELDALKQLTELVEQGEVMMIMSMIAPDMIAALASDWRESEQFIKANESA
jgi:hypothetical protein